MPTDAHDTDRCRDARRCWTPSSRLLESTICRSTACGSSRDDARRARKGSAGRRQRGAGDLCRTARSSDPWRRASAAARGLGHALTDAAFQLARDHRCSGRLSTDDHRRTVLSEDSASSASSGTDVPALSQTSIEFRSACPSSATVMRKIAVGLRRACPCESASTGSAAWGGWRLRAGWRGPGLEFAHINEVAGGPPDCRASVDLRLAARPMGRAGRERRTITY